MNFRAVAQMLGVVLVLMAGFLAVPAAVGVAMGEPGPATSCALAALVTTGAATGGPVPGILGLALLALALGGYLRLRERQQDG